MEAPAAHRKVSEGSLEVCSSIARATGPSVRCVEFVIEGFYERADALGFTYSPSQRIARAKHSSPCSFKETGAGCGAMNMPLGYALLRDRRVPIRTKLIALGIGAATVGTIELLQLPIEGVVAMLLPFIGAAGDLALDGAEAVIGPVVIATLLLPYLASPDLVRQVRTETERMAHS
jgi:hypothetical protein